MTSSHYRALRAVRFIVPFAAVLAAGSLMFSVAGNAPFSPREKAYYADPNLMNFVRPGLALKILAGDISPEGVAKVRFRITDLKGMPLDRDGVVTPGAVALSFILATIPAGQAQYNAYTTRTVQSPITGVTAIQPSTDAGGTYRQVSDGEYEYTFQTRLPAGYDRKATHSIGMTATRDLREFDLARQFDNDVFTFVPDGSKVTVVRDVVRTATCNSRCHDPLALHGGGRRKVELCVLCHQPQNMDPDTGNTVDFPVMVHKIHRGENLPSVRAGKPYQIIGNAQRVVDFSEVEFPAGIRNCEVCHDPNSGAAQKDNWLKPNRAACGACHDNVNFASGEGHVNLPQTSDSQCANCHIPKGESEFDASVRGAHTEPRFSRSLPGTVFELIRIENARAGQRPTVTFSVKDAAGEPMNPPTMARLALVLAGPTADYAGMVVEDARTATSLGNGQFAFTFPAPIPATATGSFSVGIEGYRDVKLMAGTKKEVSVRDAGMNKVMYFSVDNSPVVPRRAVVAIEKCNACHLKLEMHGSNRNRIEHCVQCHNPNQTDADRRPAANRPAQTVTFKTMVHRIHTGEDLQIEYTIYGYGGSANDFTKKIFPGDRRNCDKCHVNNSQQLPLNEDLLDVTNPRGRVDPMGPVTAACMGCHTSSSVAAHVTSMTTPVGEACAVCHGPNAEFSVNKVHAR